MNKEQISIAMWAFVKTFVSGGFVISDLYAVLEIEFNSLFGHRNWRYGEVGSQPNTGLVFFFYTRSHYAKSYLLIEAAASLELAMYSGWASHPMSPHVIYSPDYLLPLAPGDKEIL